MHQHTRKQPTFMCAAYEHQIMLILGLIVLEGCKHAVQQLSRLLTRQSSHRLPPADCCHVLLGILCMRFSSRIFVGKVISENHVSKSGTSAQSENPMCTMQVLACFDILTCVIVAPYPYAKGCRQELHIA